MQGELPAEEQQEPSPEGQEESSTEEVYYSESDADMPVKLDKDFALKFIPEFNGNRDHLHKFLSCCDIVVDSADLSASDSTMLLNIIKGKLSGPAYSIVKYKDFDAWSDLKKLLQEQYLERRTLTQIQTELVNCRQGTGESVRIFANRVERLLSDLNDACIASEGESSAEVIGNLNGKTALKAFVDGLHSHLRLIVKACRFQKLSEAVETAVEEEKAVYRPTISSKSQSHSMPKCTYCFKTGHNSSNCFSRLSSNPNRLPVIPKTEIKRESGAYQVKVLICSYCKNRGHHIKDCRKRLYNEGKNRGNCANAHNPQQVVRTRETRRALYRAVAHKDPKISSEPPYLKIFKYRFFIIS